MLWAQALRKTLQMEAAWLFAEPVPADVPDYATVVKRHVILWIMRVAEKLPNPDEVTD